MLQFLSNLLIGAYKKRQIRLEKQSELNMQAAKVLMDKAVALRKKAGEQGSDAFIAGLTVSNLEHILKPTTEVKDSGKL